MKYNFIHPDRLSNWKTHELFRPTAWQQNLGEENILKTMGRYTSWRVSEHEYFPTEKNNCTSQNTMVSLGRQLHWREITRNPGPSWEEKTLRLWRVFAAVGCDGKTQDQKMWIDVEFLSCSSMLIITIARTKHLKTCRICLMKTFKTFRNFSKVICRKLEFRIRFRSFNIDVFSYVRSSYCPS